MEKPRIQEEKFQIKPIFHQKSDVKLIVAKSNGTYLVVAENTGKIGGIAVNGKSNEVNICQKLEIRCWQLRLYMEKLCRKMVA